MSNAFGINLIGRKEGTWGHDEFFCFAALCDHFGVAQFIHYVECCHNGSCHNIELNPGYLSPNQMGAIGFSASETFSHFVLDGTSGCKGMFTS